MSLGTYRPHSLFIRIRSIADLEPGSDEPMDCAVPVHAHEYVHFLHNVSTICGVNLFRANLWLVLLMRACADDEGRVVRREPLNEDLKHWFGVATRLEQGTVWRIYVGGRNTTGKGGNVESSRNSAGRNGAWICRVLMTYSSGGRSMWKQKHAMGP